MRFSTIFLLQETESIGSDKADELHDLKRTFKEDAEETKENATESPQTIVT